METTSGNSIQRTERVRVVIETNALTNLAVCVCKACVQLCVFPAVINTSNKPSEQ